MKPASRLLLACLFLTGYAVAEPLPPIPADPRINPETGRLLATWPKDRLFDHVHMILDIDIPDVGKAYLEAVETLAVSPLGVARGSISLDCSGPKVSQVTSNGQPCSFEQPKGKLVIALPRALAVGDKTDLVIKYSLDYADGKRGEGLTFSGPLGEGKRRGRRHDIDPDSITSKSTQIHSQGEAELNSRWFPCLDHPSEKLTTELIVTVEDGYEVVSNGHLVSKTPTADGRSRWHWSQDKPHPNYLVALAVGKLAVVNVGGPGTARPGLPIPVYTPVGTEDNVKAAFANTPDMIAFFEKRFGVAYPWDKYAQVLVRDFAAGGMENTSCTFLSIDTSGASNRGEEDDLISHELAHQWFGDLVTCRSWDHLWLNEGWATYCEALWKEHQASLDSPEKGRSAYQRSFRHSSSALSLPAAVPVVSNRFTNPDAVFMKPDNPYGKGAAILNMLRCRLGDDAFFRGVHNYLMRYSFETTETDDFRRELEAASGQSLERFFSQWCDRPGKPNLEADIEWDDAGKMLKVTVEQSQTIDALNPAYALSVPVFIKLPGGTSRWEYLDMDTKSGTIEVSLPSKPTQVSLDPNTTIYCGLDVRKELSMWIEEASHGPTEMARLDAIDHLGRSHVSGEAADALAQIASDANQPALLQAAARDAVEAQRPTLSTLGK